MFDVCGEPMRFLPENFIQLNPVAIFKTLNFQRFLLENYAFEFSYRYFSC